MTDLLYLYGFVPADASPPSGVDGIAGRPVALMDLGAVCAAVSRVPAEVYDAERIESRLQDLSWVAEQGAAHETVVAWFVDHSEILPVSLFTLYSGDDALRSAVAARADELASQLDEFRSRREWDLKISADEQALDHHAGALSPRIAELEHQAQNAAPGRRYLLQKQRDDLLRSETRSAAHALARDAFDALKAHAVEARTLPIPRLSDELPVILHAALLVDKTEEETLVAAFEEQSERLAHKGLSLSFSGPWAPYRFAGEHDE